MLNCASELSHVCFGATCNLGRPYSHANQDFEILEEDNNCEDDDGCDEVHEVGQSVSPERPTKGMAFIVPSEQVEQGDNGTFEFGPRPMLTVVEENAFQAVDSRM